ncbi:MAG: hypothetical protein BHV67_16425 [Bacteroidales bacterium 43_36]|nr:MAG: hypothetical protein BHV67_16425 [Bacteroidales bacterium 43_36]
MTPNDKNYVDRLHNQQVNELNEIKNRLLILEGKTTATTDGNIRVEIDTDKIYEMFLKACHDCLQQRQERHQEEDRQAEELLRQECEAKGERYFSNVHEWRAAIARDYDAFFQKMIGIGKIADRHYRDIKIALHKILNEPSSDPEPPKTQPLFSNLPSGFLSKLTALRLRLSNCIRNYLTGNFTLPRGWTLLTILLYSLSFILLLLFRITIMVSG